MTVEELNIEARYPDVKRSFREKCTKEFTLEQIRVIKEIYKWLKAKINQTKSVMPIGHIQYNSDCHIS